MNRHYITSLYADTEETSKRVELRLTTQLTDAVLSDVRDRDGGGVALSEGG